MTKLVINVIDHEGKEVEKKSSFEALNDYEVRAILISEVIRSELLSLRSGNAHTKGRGEVRGGGKKPWKQKGTGRARHGSIRSPIWKGGGVTFGPKNTRNWNRKINKTARTAAIKSLIKDRLDESLISTINIIKDLETTKQAVSFIDNVLKGTELKSKNLMLVYTTEEKESLKGFKNTDVQYLNAKNIKISKLANGVNLIFTPKALEVMEIRVSK